MITSIVLTINSCLLIWQCYSYLKVSKKYIDSLDENITIRKKYIEMLKIIQSSETIEEIRAKVLLSIQYHKEPVESSHE